MADELWARGRSGAIAGRGFHYQDTVATLLAVRAWCGELPLVRLVPEGLEDISLRLDDHWLHLQVKSRQEHRGQFELATVGPAWRHLAERLAFDGTARAGLVLERPLPGVETGFNRPLAEIAPEPVRLAVAAAVADVMDPEDFLARSHVVVMPSPEQATVERLAGRLGVPPASCVAHHAILCRRLAHLADENARRAYSDQADITAGEIARLLDDVNEAIDPSVLDEAVLGGLAELVDFATPIDDERFFAGVDVVAGHVVAGLPLPRPEVALLVGGLDARQVALAVGPSGAGKSALIWLTAYASRHSRHWYRVRRLREDDVPALVRLVKGLSPFGTRVGLVVDDLGREDRAGFDRLVEELRGHPAACVLGACREEDLFVLRTAYGAAQVRAELGPELAERIWRELHDQGRTAWAQWREPYERSRGLLLEYGHLLTEGTRLAETVAAQVDRRVREQRWLELDVLAVVTTADAFGAEIDATSLTAALDVDQMRMRGALARLVDEHLIHQRDGLLGGLHETRSRHVMDEVHRLSSPALAGSVRRVIDLVAGTGLQPFLTRLLSERAVADEVVVDAVATRLYRQPDPAALAAALHALRLVGLRRTAAEWAEVLDVEGVGPCHASLATLMAQGDDTTIFPEPFRNAVERIRRLDPVDLRGPLLAKIATRVSVACTTGNVRSAATVLAALGEIGQTAVVDPAGLARMVDGASLSDVRLLLEAAYAASAKLAEAVAGELGGSEALLERLERERPWVRGAHLDVNPDGRLMAEAEYAYVAESAQPPAHDTVVDLARTLAALVPAAEVTVCRAVDARGRTAGFAGVPLAHVRIDRRLLPSRSRVAWARARGRAAVAAVAARTETDHLLAARDLIISAARLVRRVGDAWTRGGVSATDLIEATGSLARAAKLLPPSPIAVETAGPLEEGELALDYPCHFVATMISANLLPRLYQGENAAPVIPQIIKKIDELAEPALWRLVDQPPLTELAGLRATLHDLHDFLIERDRGPADSLAAAGRSGGLVAAAAAARQHAAARTRTIVRQLDEALAAAGVMGRVLYREPDPVRPPGDDFLVLVELPAINDWPRKLETLANLCRSALEGKLPFLMAPVREGRVVGSLAVRVIHGIFPAHDQLARDWPEAPLPFLEERLGDLVRRGVRNLSEASGILASVRGDVIHDEEAAVLQVAIDGAREAIQHVEDLAATRGDELPTQVETTLRELVRLVEGEVAALARGAPVSHGVAASMLDGINGQADDVFVVYLGTMLACVEWDVEPDGAWDRMQR